MALTVAYITNRKENLFWWFISSLRRQITFDSQKPRIIVVDFWNQVMPHHSWLREHVINRQANIKSMAWDFDFVHLSPKPTPWQGPYRLTAKDYFAASNSRNTAIIHARDGHLAFVDDLSLLLPTWLAAVNEACDQNRITAGAFQKLKRMVVDEGELKSFSPHPEGVDSRWKHGNDSSAVECPPNWTFGCSLVAPIDRFLEINGYPEESDSTGIAGEDTAVGVALANIGHKVYYDRRMLTYESEEHHHQGPVMARDNKKKPGSIMTDGTTHPNHKDHMFVAKNKRAKRFENYFGPDGIAGIRKRVLAGEPIAQIVLPTKDWYDGEPLEQLCALEYYAL